MEISALSGAPGDGCCGGRRWVRYAGGGGSGGSGGSGVATRFPRISIKGTG